MKKSIENGEHYNWGKGCSGWHLAKTSELSIIQESMPPNTYEQRHYHNFSQQFFYILNGEANFILKNAANTISEGEGFHIEPKTEHQVKNDSIKILDFPVISQPTTRGDRIDNPITKNT